MRTYGELKEALAAWLNRRDLTDQIPGFIQLAEADIFRTLRCRDNEYTARYDNTADPGLFKSLPFNFLEMHNVFWNGRALQQVSEQQLQAMRSYGGAVPRETQFFSIWGRQIDFYPEIPDDPAEWGDSVLQYNYFGGENLSGQLVDWGAPLNPGMPQSNPVSDRGNATSDLVNEPGKADVDDANTTRLLLRQPNLYLYGSLHHAHDFLQRHDEADRWLQKWSQVMEAIERASAEADFTGSTATNINPYPDDIRVHRGGLAI
jgi:hypothetical protein